MKTIEIEVACTVEYVGPEMSNENDLDGHVEIEAQGAIHRMGPEKV